METTESICVFRGLLETTKPPPARPVATRKVMLPDGAPWIDIGLSPLIIMSRQLVMYVVSDAPPEETLGDGFRLEPRVMQAIDLISRVWAKTASTGGAELIVAGPV